MGLYGYIGVIIGIYGYARVYRVFMDSYGFFSGFGWAGYIRLGRLVDMASVFITFVGSVGWLVGWLYILYIYFYTHTYLYMCSTKYAYFICKLHITSLNIYIYIYLIRQ